LAQITLWTSGDGACSSWRPVAAHYYPCLLQWLQGESPEGLVEDSNGNFFGHVNRRRARRERCSSSRCGADEQRQCSPAFENAASFTVSGPASTSRAVRDRSYSIFVSDNFGSFKQFLTNTTQTSATFVGQLGHNYGFYSIATDRPAMWRLRRPPPRQLPHLYSPARSPLRLPRLQCQCQDDLGEPALAGQTLFLDLNDNGILDPGEPTATTNINAPTVSRSCAGTYTLRQCSGGSFLSTPAKAAIVDFTNASLSAAKCWGCAYSITCH